MSEMQLSTSHLLRVKQTKLALMKALSSMMSTGMSTSALAAAAVAARVMRRCDMPFRTVVGFTQLPGSDASFPHVWLVSPGDLVTDLSFSQPLRTVHMLGQSVAFDDEALKPTFSLTPLHAVPVEHNGKRIIDTQILLSHAKDLEAYLAGAPPSLRASVDSLVSKCLDGTEKVEFSGASLSLIQGMAAAAAAASVSEQD